MKKRTNEAKWIESKKRWQINVTNDDGQRKTFVSTVGLSTRKGKLEAERKADEWLETNCSIDMRFGVAFERFLAAKKRECGTSRIRQLESLGRLWLCPTLEHKKVSKITQQDWKDCILTAYERGKSKKSLSNIRGVITAFHSYCMDAGITTVPLRNITIPKDAPVGERHILQPDGLKTLFTVDTITLYGKPRPCWFIYAWRLMVVLGLRRGELCGLQANDIKDGKLYINRSVNEFSEITNGKTEAARRYMVLPAYAKNILHDQAEMLKAASIVSPWLFPNEFGAMADPNSVYNHWITYCRQHGIQASLHELRHTHISVMQNTVPENALKRAVGHTKTMDTFGIYGHDFEGEAEKTAKLINSVWEELL